MIVYPAVDIRHGRVVRLLYGDPDRETVYGDDPVTMAKQWESAGATWLHVVNLDGALGENVTALDTLRKIVTETGLRVQFGGGIRTLDAVQQALDAGATRVVVGTLFVEHPEWSGEAVRRWGAEAIVAALDVKGGRVATRGWQDTVTRTPSALGKYFASTGLRHVLYTDVSKDGDLSGVNVSATARLAQETGLDVIASGGVAQLDDIRAVKAARTIAGVVVGRALYTGQFTLQEALDVAQGE